MGQNKRQQKTVEVMACLGKIIQEALDKFLPNSGFVLIFFKSHEEGFTNYLTNTKRESMVNVLKETVKGLEKEQDFPTFPQTPGAVH